jgi:Protein of unknown function with HXXEE motif
MPTVNLQISDASYLWIFAAVLVIHLIEELWGGSRSRDPHNLKGLDLSRNGFIFTNLVALMLFAGGSVLALELRFPQFMLVALATFVLVNGLGHLLTSIKDATYSPGLVSAVLFFIPLGVFIVITLHPKMGSLRFSEAIAAGLGMQLTASLVAHRGRQVVRAIRARTRAAGARDLLNMESETIAINENLKG